ncbi:MAG: DUF3842 family protein [Treponema sp.]|jgi:hypothetical protein|nr:DUF3842 family protein [Treponema sp.]
MNKPIVVIDGMGGGIGAQLISRLRELLDERQDIIALGANFGATERMLKAGATRGATGENAIRVSVRLGGLIAGPIGIIIPNSMMGEITPVMAESILAAPGERILLPVKNEHFTLPGLDAAPLAKIIDLAATAVKERLDGGNA